MTEHSIRNILKRAAAKAGVAAKEVMPHRLRHHFGLASTIAGVPTTALMRAMGHRSPLMTARYAEFADSERRAAFARADIAQGIRFPGAKQRIAGPARVAEALEQKGTSVSETARKLFRRG
jgi:integrase